jgi:hypothetical protein
MGISACIIGAIAVEEVRASRHTIVRRLVGQVAQVSIGTSTVAEERLADGDLVRIVVEATLCAEGTDTCEYVRCGRECLPTDDVIW